jgi:multicomponent Na+:H+ antiporter subunit D
LGALGANFAISLVMAAATAGGSRILFEVGAAPWNVSLSVGPLEAFMACLFTGIAFLIMWASVTMIEHDVEAAKVPLYYTLICSLIAMLCGVVFFDNLVNVFLFIELSSFAAAGIVIIKNQPENIRAGLKYLTLSILGSGLVLMGIVILYSLTGSLTMSGIHKGLLANFKAGPVLYAMIFISIGVAFKSALFPLHIWLPDAHGTAPSPSSAVLSSLVLKAYIIFFIKMLYVSVGHNFISHDSGLSMLLYVILIFGVIAMLAGSVLAILQTDIKRMIAYSSVAQIGYIFMGLGLGNRLGLYAAIFHILAHAVTKAGLFLVAGSIIEQTHNRKLDQMGGLGIQMPITMALFAIGALSMVGIPLFVGFNSKWNFAMSIMDSQKFWVMIALAISSLLNALYYLPVVVRAFFGAEARAKAAEGKSLERPVSALMPIIILACFVVLLAVVFSGPVSRFIEAGTASIW